MQIIAHRGISARYLENTMQAYERALHSKAVGIEVDLHEVDRDFILYHDYKLDKLTNIRADIAELTMDDIRKIRFNDGQSIPLLSELFSLVKGKFMLNLELKAIANPALLANQIEQYIHKYNAKVVISSFNHPLLATMQQLFKNSSVGECIQFGAIIGHLPVDMARYALDLQVEIAVIDIEMVTEDFVKHAHQHNLKVWSYTINHKHDFLRLKSMGVDAVFSNDPDDLL